MELRLKRLDDKTIKILKAPSSGAPKTWLAGRGTCCHIYTKSKYASRKHFSITYREKKYYISDLESSNGTFVNGNKITCEEIISCGNVISVGVPSILPNSLGCIAYVSEIHSAPVEEPVICIIDEPVENCEKPIRPFEDAHQKKNKDNVDGPHVVLPKNIDCINLTNESVDEDNEKNEVEETAVNISVDEVIVIESCSNSLKHCRQSRSPPPVPVKVRKLEVEEGNGSCGGGGLGRDFNEEPVKREKDCRLDEEDDMEVYEALTQVDEPKIKTEKYSLNYSQSEELIEISDSEEEDWSIKNIEEKKWNGLLEIEEEEDDEVVFIESVVKPKTSKDSPTLVSKIEDDLTETDKKWLGKLMGIKCESGPFIERQAEEKIQSRETAEGEYEEDCVVSDGLQTSGKVFTFIGEVSEPGVEVPRLGLEVPTPSLEVPTPSLEVPTPSLEVPTPSLEVPTPSLEVPTPNLEVPTPSSEVSEPDGEVPSPALEDPTFEKVPKLGKVPTPGGDVVTHQREVLTFGGEVPTRCRERISLSAAPAKESPLPSCVVKLQRIEPDDYRLDEIRKRTISIREEGKSVKKPSKKHVTFDLNPKVKYFEIPERIKLTPIEKGMLRFTRIIFNICNWNTVWLEECKRISSDKVPPDICDAPLRKIPKRFRSHEEYMSSYVPVMLLHLWNKVKDKWKNFGTAAFKQTLSCDFYEDHPADNLCVYKCTGLVQNVDAHRQLVREGHLVMLRLHPVFDATDVCSKYSKKVGYLVFGYVETKAYERFRDQPLHKILAERCSSARGVLHLVRLTILVKRRSRLEVDKQKLMQMTVVEHISSEIRIFRGICFLPQSALLKAILKPCEPQFVLTAPPEKTDVFFTGPLDNHQKELVSKLTHTIFSTDSFLYCIHGAAGTGKGQVVISFIFDLLYGKESKEKGKPKIIYCAPSDGPLDEMVVRLKSCRESLGASKFSMVRVGSIKQIKPEVRDFALSNLMQKHRSSDKTVKEGMRRDLEIGILRESDVICAICSPVGLNKLIPVFDKRCGRNKNQKIICILDEAMNIREPDSLLPLLLGVTHLLLVGDIHQLEPPCSGEKTRSLGLDMTLFWRIYKNTGHTADHRPISILKTQYRMNPALSRFAGKVIYNRVQHDSDVNGSKKIPSLQSYLVVVDEKVDVDPANWKNREGRIVVELVKAIMKVTKEAKERAFNLSIITSDPDLTEVIKSLVPKREFSEVEIGEVEKFQGKETDVVVLACDAAKILVSQMAVAMTRARSSLFVVTTQRSVTSNLWFDRLSSIAKAKEAFRSVRPDSGSEVFERMVAE